VVHQIVSLLAITPNTDSQLDSNSQIVTLPCWVEGGSIYQPSTDFEMFDKARNVKGLHQQVCQLLFQHVNWKDLYETGLDPLSEVMVLLIDLLSLRAYHGCLGQVNGPSIVFKVIYH
jgi:hypothetical protein